jgi:hypothetical protein
MREFEVHLVVASPIDKGAEPQLADFGSIDSGQPRASV